MYKKDYHGMLLEDALRDAEAVIGGARASKQPLQVEFVTGFGVIRPELFKLLERYSLQPRYKMGNEGTIVVTIV